MAVESIPNHYRADIDGLRGLAILSVVAFHAFPAAWPGGFAGVDIFFVISGFVISSTIFRDLERGTFSFGDFFARRVRRLFPALIVVLLGTCIAAWFFLLPDEMRVFGKHVFAGAGFVENLVLWKETGYFDKSIELKPLMHLWSIAVEMQFYLFYPLLLWLAWRRKRAPLGVILAFFTFSLAYCLWPYLGNVEAKYFVPQARLWEFLAGAVLAYAEHVQGEIKVSQYVGNGVGALGLFLVISSPFVLHTEPSFPNWRILIPVLGTVIITAIGKQTWFSRKLLAFPLVVFIGRLSYPLYLWHWPLLSLTKIAKFRWPSSALLASLVAISFVLAYLTFQFVEKPLRHQLKSRWLVPGLCAGAIMFVIAGLLTYGSNGMMFRYPLRVRDVFGVHIEPGDPSWQVCLLSPQQAGDAFSPRCRVADATALGRIAVWGDSHASAFVVGLRKAVANRNVAQFTRASCPPTLTGDPVCVSGNKFVHNVIAQEKYETVVLFADWLRLDWENPDHFAELIKETIVRLRASGVQRIILIGPGVQWSKDVPRVVYEKWRSEAFAGDPPSRSNLTNSDLLEPIDRMLMNVAQVTGAKFFSIVNLLCNRDGCLTRTEGLPADFMCYDDDHLSPAGALFVARSLFGSGLAIR